MQHQRPIGPYVVEHRLAAGGMAEVFVAKRVGPHGFSKRLAVKRILPQFATDPDFVAMFIDEARLAARLAHPNVVQVFDFGEHGGDLYLAMELVDGTNVSRLLRAVSAKGTVVPLDIALHIVAQTAHALRYAHEAVDDEGRPLGFVHRDVSPANILLTRDGHVKLTDFGIATAAVRTRRTEDGHVRGKLGYMSPEQVLGRPLTGKSDVFTLTTVFAEMLLGEPLFGTGKDLDVLLRIRDVELAALDRTDRDIPSDIRQLLRRGLSRDLDERPDSQTFADACDELIRRRGVGHGPDRLARLLQKLGLIEGTGDPSDGGKPISAPIEAAGIGEDTDRLLGDVGATAPPIYRVRIAGQELGPMSFPRLVRMFTSAEILADTPVSKEDGEFDEAMTLPELARFVESPALRWDDEDLMAATARGSVAEGALLPLFFERLRESATGVLHLRDGARRKKIYLVEGRPEFVASTDRHELLGEYLVSAEHCMRVEVEMALNLLPRYGGRLGDALVGLGVLRPGDLFRAIAGQVRERFLEAFRWRRGRWSWVPEARSGEDSIAGVGDVYHLLRDAAARIHPEEVRLAVASLGLDPLAWEPRPFVSAAAFTLPEAFQRVLARVDGRATAQQVIESALRERDADETTTLQALFFAFASGLVRPVRG